MPAKTFAYARVSSTEQNLARQIDSLMQYVENERDIYCDKMTGASFERPAYQALKQVLREGDTVYFHSLDRLGRDRKGLKEEWLWFHQHGIRVKILDLPTTMTDFSKYGGYANDIMEMVTNILLEVLGTMAEHERKAMRKRQKEGLDAARRRGVKFGRPKKRYKDFVAWRETFEAWYHNKILAVKACKRLGVCKSTFYQMTRDYMQDMGIEPKPLLHPIPDNRKIREMQASN